MPSWLATKFGGRQEPRVTTFDSWRNTVENAVGSGPNGSRSAPGRSIFGSNRIRPARDNNITQAARTAMGLQSADTCCPKLSFQDRVHGTLACFVIGLVLSMLGTMMWWTGKTRTFAFLYTTGNIVSICGTGFLIGPRRQIRNMCAAKRWIATSIYVTMMVLTVTLAFLGAHKLLVLGSVFVQWAAMVWYIASYIPFGQRMISRMFKSVTDF